jgi:hypothetical protein
MLRASLRPFVCELVIPWRESLVTLQKADVRAGIRAPGTRQGSNGCLSLP